MKKTGGEKANETKFPLYSIWKKSNWEWGNWLIRKNGIRDSGFGKKEPAAYSRQPTAAATRQWSVHSGQ